MVKVDIKDLGTIYVNPKTLQYVGRDTYEGEEGLSLVWGTTERVWLGFKSKEELEATLKRLIED